MENTRGARTRLVRAAAGSVAAILLAAWPSGPATAAGATFPTTEQVATVLPGLAGAEPRVYDGLGVLTRLTTTRVYDRLWCKERTIKVRSVSSATYGDTPAYLDQTPVELAVFRRGTETSAKDALRAMRDGIRACRGRTTQIDGVKMRMKRIRVPASVATDAAAYWLEGDATKSGVVLTVRQGAEIRTVQIRISGASRATHRAVAFAVLPLFPATQG